MTDDSCLVTVVRETECDSPKLDLEILTIYDQSSGVERLQTSRPPGLDLPLDGFGSFP